MNRGVIDIGNTRVKAAVFNEEGNLIDKEHFPTQISALQWIKEKDGFHVMAASVNTAMPETIEGLNIISLNADTILPFQNLYSTPHTLGADRIAAMSAAASIFPEKAVLVFDIGTCMTIDLLEPGKIYRGGNISPGIKMRLRAMHEMTGRLPLAESEDATEILGVSTKTALASGVITGMKHEIEGYCREFSKIYPDLVSVVCGGDYSYFDIQSKYRIFAAPNFVLQGLYHLLLLNEK